MTIFLGQECQTELLRMKQTVRLTFLLQMKGMQESGEIIITKRKPQELHQKKFAQLVAN